LVLHIRINVTHELSLIKQYLSLGKRQGRRYYSTLSLNQERAARRVVEHLAGHQHHSVYL
ncbi:hypothetical protein JY493_26875, partial [Serratia marcescens]|nr:hypothetical protein [Serratia marcescens]